MKREFDYKNISLADIEANKHLIFVCSGDDKKVLLEKVEKENV